MRITMAQVCLHLKIIIAGILAAVLTACAPSAPSGEPATPAAGAPVDPVVTIPGDNDIYKPESLLWEGQHVEGLLWSALSYRLIGSALEGKAIEPADVRDFCPRYRDLSTPERVNFWAFLSSAVVKYESGFNPLKRIRAEDDDTDDDVTGKPTYKEGLMQLSYKHLRKLKACAVDWNKDKNLKPNDPRRSILNPVINIECGLHAFLQQVQQRKEIAAAATLWTSLKRGGKDSRIHEIQALTRSLPFCR